MDKKRSLAALLVLFTIYGVLCDIQIYYMDERCGTTIDMAEVHSALVETSMALTYGNNLDCEVTFKAPTGKRFFLQVRRFLTEKTGGLCYDYLDLYDGSSTSSPTLSAELCGEITSIPEYYTTSAAVTFKFTSDSSAKDRGFSVYLLAFREGLVCTEDEIQCVSENICIDEVDSLCDNFDHCKDKSDEASCSLGLGSTNKPLLSSIGLIVGLSIAALAVLAAIFFIVYQCYKKYKWNQYIKQLYNNKNLVGSKIQAAYPLTHRYQTDEYINITRAEKNEALVQAEDVLRSESRSQASLAREDNSCQSLSKMEASRASTPSDGQRKTPTDIFRSSSSPSNNNTQDEPENKKEGMTPYDGVLVGPEQLGEDYEGYDNPALDLTNDKITEL